MDVFLFLTSHSVTILGHLRCNILIYNEMWKCWVAAIGRHLTRIYH